MDQALLKQADDEHMAPCHRCGAPALNLAAMQVPLFLKNYVPLCTACIQRESIQRAASHTDVEAQSRLPAPPPPPISRASDGPADRPRHRPR